MALGSSGSGKTVLSKVIVESAVLQGIPAICIDPQGDLVGLARTGDPAALEEHGVPASLAERWRERVEVCVFTPASRRGVPLTADPIDPLIFELEPRERTRAISRAAAMVTAVLGYDIDSDDGQGLTAVLDLALNALTSRAAREGPPTLAALAAHLQSADDETLGRYAHVLDERKIRTAVQRLTRLNVGARRQLFFDGGPHRHRWVARSKREPPRGDERTHARLGYLFEHARHPRGQGAVRRRARRPTLRVDARAPEPRAPGAVLSGRGRAVHPAGPQARLQADALAPLQASAQVRGGLCDGDSKPWRRRLQGDGAVWDVGAGPAHHAPGSQEGRADDQGARARRA